MATALITIGLIALFFALMSIRLIFLKDGQFKGTCASQSPYLNKEGTTCGYCGKKVGEDDACGKEDEESESEVNKVLSRFS